MNRLCSNCGSVTKVSGPGCYTPNAWCKQTECQKKKKLVKNQSYRGSDKHKQAIKRRRERIKKDPAMTKKKLSWQKSFRSKERMKLISAYGGKCAYCGDCRPWVLQLDHKRDDGAEHRKAVSSSKIYAEIRRSGYPQDRFQVLCANCNFGKNLYGAEFVIAATILGVEVTP